MACFREHPTEKGPKMLPMRNLKFSTRFVIHRAAINLERLKSIVATICNTFYIHHAVTNIYQKWTTQKYIPPEKRENHSYLFLYTL